jgi:hypothetical protein
MNDKTRRVLNGWMALNATERADFERAVRDYNTTSYTKQEELRESVHDRVIKVQTGPLGQGCPCCGR